MTIAAGFNWTNFKNDQLDKKLFAFVGLSFGKFYLFLPTVYSPLWSKCIRVTRSVSVIILSFNKASIIPITTTLTANNPRIILKKKIPVPPR